MVRKRLSWLLVIILFISCDQDRVLDSYETIPEQWHHDSIVSFKFVAPDTIQDFDLFLNVRNTSEYAFSNLYVITNLRFPNGKVLTDTLQYEMAEPSGEWLGTGFGEVKESKLWYKENFRFSEAGNYLLEVQQAMRRRDSVMPIENLEGITEIGFRIENDKQ